MLIFLIMIFLAFIVSNSLIQTSIEQRQYESAMLRILGWNNKYIIIVTILKSIIFNIIPGAVLGLYIASWITHKLKEKILEYAKIDLDLEFTNEAMYVGIACAFALPLLSMM